MVRAWVSGSIEGVDGHLANERQPNVPVSLNKLKNFGVWYWRVEGGADSPKLRRILENKNLQLSNTLSLTVETESKVKSELALGDAPTILSKDMLVYAVEGNGFIDFLPESGERQWIRIAVKPCDCLLFPARSSFNLWLPADTASLQVLTAQTADSQVPRTHESKDEISFGINGQSIVVDEGAPALAHYPHMRIVNGFLYISGLSSRRPNGTHIGVRKDPDGSVTLDISEQTEGLLSNMSDLLETIGADMNHLVDVTVFLVDMSYYGAFNKVYNVWFDAATGPTRTTVAVKQLPHPNILIEIKAVAVAPKNN
eukprot:TRINITY_DN779_c0_g1_i1.p1 TRINITY_DN779_c0_g1~~TRINITY_DN779_c0_g1_i1.p1  ORF type:complete len:312 (-),score=36.39 TRINITY_DN779_c0_g1_i1:24-959(-)